MSTIMEVANRPKIGSFIDPITLDDLFDPWLHIGCSKDFNYSSVLSIIEKHKKCPWCAAVVTMEDFIPNRTLKSGLEEMQQQALTQMKEPSTYPSAPPLEVIENQENLYDEAPSKNSDHTDPNSLYPDLSSSNAEARYSLYSDLSSFNVEPSEARSLTSERHPLSGSSPPPACTSQQFTPKESRARRHREALMQDSKRSTFKTIIFGMGWFFSFGQFGTQSAAENLLTKPTYELTAAIKFLYKVNTKVLLPSGYAPMTFENLGAYIDAISNGNLLGIDGNGELVEVTGALQLEEDESEVLYLQKRKQQLELKALVYDFTPSFFEVDRTHRTAVKKPQALLEAAQKAIIVWTDAINTVKDGLNDAQFEKLVAQATNNVLAVDFHELDKISGDTAKFLEMNAAAIWAKNNTRQFSKEIADKFIAAKELGGNLNSQAIDTLLRDINTRARRIRQILGKDLKQHKKAIIIELHNNPGFVTALQRMQGNLKKVVADNQNLRLIFKPQLEALQKAFKNIQGVDEIICTFTVKGEAAAIAAIDIVNNTLDQVKLIDSDLADSIQKTVGTTVENIHSVQKALQILLNDNTDIIAEGQGKAENALADLDCLNQLTQLKTPLTPSDLFVNLAETNKKIGELKASDVAKILKDDLLKILDDFAGAESEGTNDGSPTLLFHVLQSLGQAGLGTILRKTFDVEILLDTMFVKVSPIESRGAKVNMYIFNPSRKTILKEFRSVIKAEFDRKES